MQPVCLNHRMTLAAAFAALGVIMVGICGHNASAAPPQQQGADEGKDGLEPLARGGVTDLSGVKKQISRDDAEASDQSLIVLKSEETVQDGSTEWGPEAGETYISPRYVNRNFLTIKSKVDDITIVSISVNRGNCSSFDFGLPMKMKFGQDYKVFVECDPLEAIVRTDHGLYSFGWQQ